MIHLNSLAQKLYVIGSSCVLGGKVMMSYRTSRTSEHDFFLPLNTLESHFTERMVLE